MVELAQVGEGEMQWVEDEGRPAAMWPADHLPLCLILVSLIKHCLAMDRANKICR
jgi:hypothetical protein